MSSGPGPFQTQIQQRPTTPQGRGLPPVQCSSTRITPRAYAYGTGPFVGVAFPKSPSPQQPGSFLSFFLCSFLSMFLSSCVPLFLCSFIPTRYVPFFLCSFPRMFLSSYVPMFLCSYVPLSLCSCGRRCSPKLNIYIYIYIGLLKFQKAIFLRLFVRARFFFFFFYRKSYGPVRYGFKKG